MFVVNGININNTTHNTRFYLRGQLILEESDTFKKNGKTPTLDDWEIAGAPTGSLFDNGRSTQLIRTLGGVKPKRVVKYVEPEPEPEPESSESDESSESSGSEDGEEEEEIAEEEESEAESEVSHITPVNKRKKHSRDD